MLVLPLAPANHLLFNSISDHLLCSRICVLASVSLAWELFCLSSAGLPLPHLSPLSPL